MKTVAATLAVSLLSSTAAWAGVLSPEYPDGILCPAPATADRPAGIGVLYISGALSDGRVLYQTLGPRVVSVMFDASGVPDSPFCAGKTLSELVAEGQTFDF